MLGTWIDCPLQAKFKYIDRLPVERESAASYFGTAIHSALEEYVDHRDPDKAVGSFTALWDELPVGLWYPRTTSFSGYQALGQQIIRQYHEESRWVNRKILATEHGFCVPFGDHELQGYVDLLESSKDAKGKQRLKIVDFKTASKHPSRVALTQNIQMTTYYYASLQPEFWTGTDEIIQAGDRLRPGQNVGDRKFPGFENGEELFEEYKKAKRSVIWYQLRTNKSIDAGPRDMPDFMRLYRAAKEIERAIEHEVYVPDIGADSCLWCDYHQPCGLPIKENFS